VGAEAASNAAAQASPDAAFAFAHKKLLSDNAIQFDLPAYVPPTPPTLPPWLRALFKALGDALPMAGPGVKSLLWAVLAVAVGLALFGAYRFARRRWPRVSTAADDGVEWRPDAAPARALLDEADALAAGGRYGEAAHLVLLRSVEQIAARRPAALRPSLTSRDIVREAPLPTDVRSAFAAIADIVEAGVFAARPVGQAAWLHARAAYEDIAFPKAWG
jgi:hypothetical protein